ncbi:MAG TPA: RNA polymerase sigma factor [Sedimentisphaerales bacterium]|nr:RNA polymerase sigma factor [Sedimentisphaerales bacterium]
MGQVRRLCRQAKAGDKRAAAELLRLSYEKIFNYLRRLSSNAADAEDLTQETFAKVWSALGDFRGQSEFSTWVHGIAYHVYIDWRRRKEPVVQTDAWWQERVELNPGLFKCAEDKQLVDRLYRLVDQLTEDKKQIIHLHFYQGLSLRDTAYVLNEAPSTVKYRFRKIMESLRSQMNKV